MKTLIFDFDGTIADSFGVFLNVFEEVTKRKDKITAAEIETLRGMRPREILKHLGIKRWQIPRLLVAGRRAMSKHIADVSPIAGLPAVLRDLHAQGYRMMILSTNSSENIRQFLKKNRLDDCFEEVVGGAGIFNKATALRKMIKKYSLQKTDCIYIGDEVRDIEAAAKAKLDYISAAWGYNSLPALERAQPMALAKKPRHLPQLLKRISAQ